MKLNELPAWEKPREKLLREGGIRCSLQRTPKWMEARGCGYSLQIRTDDLDRVLVLLRRSGVPMQKVYIQNEEGNLEELRL